jgi:hypothetical protein
VGTKHDRKASRKEIPRPPPSAERWEADDAVVATEKRDKSPLPLGLLSPLRLPAERPMLRPIIILDPVLHCTSKGKTRGGGLAGCCLDGLDSGGLTMTRETKGSSRASESSGFACSA